MGDRILFVVGSGMGNQAETISAFVRAKRKYGNRLDVANSFPYAFNITKVLFNGLTENIMLAKDVPKENYEGQICTYLAHDFPIKGVPHIVRQLPVRGKSEVEHNMTVTGETFSDDDLCDFGGAMDYIKARPDTPDVLIHNGYNKVKVGNPDKWKAKSYGRWSEVIVTLKARGYTVGTICTPDEYIEGTENHTGLAFEDSVAAIKGCRVLLANDTGTYHVANVVACPNVAVFTFTDRVKNYDNRFHRFTTLVASDMPCSPCQFNGKHFWLRNRANCKWACRDIEPNRVLEAAEGWLKDTS
jgi:hypothetical protein